MEERNGVFYNKGVAVKLRYTAVFELDPAPKDPSRGQVACHVYGVSKAQATAAAIVELNRHGKLAVTEGYLAKSEEVVYRPVGLWQSGW